MGSTRTGLVWLRALLLSPGLLVAFASQGGVVEDASALQQAGNPGAAMALLRPAAEAGDTAAQVLLGSAHVYAWAGQRDPAEAYRWFRRAAESGDVEGACNTAVLLAGGDGVPTDAAAAVDWYRRAAEQGHRSAEYNLGLLYE